MSDSLSQDELDALLSDMGSEEESSDATENSGSSMESQSGSNGGGSLSSEEQSVAEAISEALKSGGGGLGVMLGGESSIDHVSTENIDGTDIQNRFSDQTVVFHTELSGPISDSIALCFAKEDAAAFAAKAMGKEASEVEFSEEELESLSEIIGPVLIGIARALSSRAGSQVNTSPIQAAHMTGGKNFPIRVDNAVLMQAPLTMEGVMDNDISLVVPRTLISEVADTAGEASAPAPAAGGTQATAAQESGDKKLSGAGQNLNLLLDVLMPLTVELGRTKMYVKEVLTMGEGSIIELDKLAGEPVDLMVNGKMIAKGEVVVIDENFGVRVTDVVSPNERMKMSGKGNHF